MFRANVARENGRGISDKKQKGDSTPDENRGRRVLGPVLVGGWGVGGCVLGGGLALSLLS